MGLLTRWDPDARRAVDVEIDPRATLLASLAAALLGFIVLVRSIRRRRIG
jgi:hypothetical protein